MLLRGAIRWAFRRRRLPPRLRAWKMCPTTPTPRCGDCAFREEAVGKVVGDAARPTRSVGLHKTSAIMQRGWRRYLRQPSSLKMLCLLCLQIKPTFISTHRATTLEGKELHDVCQCCGPDSKALSSENRFDVTKHPRAMAKNQKRIEVRL